MKERILKKRYIFLVLFIVSLAFAYKWVYEVDPEACTGCGNCIPWCAYDALSMQGPVAYIDPEICNACGICALHCPWDAIHKVWYTSVEEEETEQFEMYVLPNPSNGFFIVSGLNESTVLRIMDISGRLVYSGMNNDSEICIDLTSCNSGVYFIEAEDGIIRAISIVR